jgi:hypothetical protein
MPGPGLTFGTGGKSHPQNPRPCGASTAAQLPADVRVTGQKNSIPTGQKLAPASAPGLRRPCQQPSPTGKPDANMCAASRMIAVAVLAAVPSSERWAQDFELYL